MDFGELFGGAEGAASTNEALANTGSSYRLPTQSEGARPGWVGGAQKAVGAVQQMPQAQPNPDDPTEEKGGGLKKIAGIIGTVLSFL